MGYDVRRFVGLSPDIADHFKCPICLDIFETPLELPCGHIYCLQCLSNFSRNGTSAIECPECRARIEFSELKPPNRKVLGLLHNLTIKCDFSDHGCTELIKVENLIAHTRNCRFNGTSLQILPNAPSSAAETARILVDRIIREDRFSSERHRLEALINFYARDETNTGRYEVLWNDDYFLINDVRLTNEVRWNDFWINDGFCERLRGWISLFFWGLLVLSITVASIAAIVISALKLRSCNQVPTLPRALMALGISMLLTVILETTRMRYYRNKICIGLKFIELFALASLTYLAVVTYSNLDYTTKSIPHSCDGLVFGFSFFFVSGLLFLTIASALTYVMCLIYNNLKTIWAEWHGSYVLLVFIYSIPIVSLVMSVGTVTIGSIYSDSCAGIPSLTTRLIVFGAFGVLCWLTMLLISDYKNCFLWILLSGLLISFICLAVTVHQNFTSLLTLLHYSSNENNNCNIIYTYSFFIVCVNYMTIGSTILIYSMYAGIWSFLFFR